MPQSTSLNFDFRQQTFTVADGLPDNQVFDLFQHPNGFVYILTRSGISRWDGFEFITFPADTPSLSWNTNSLKLTPWGNHHLAIMLGGANFYLSFHTRTGKFEQHKFPVPKAINNPITWDGQRILFATGEFNKTDIWEMTDAGSEKLLVLLGSPNELSGFKVIGNSLWWNVNGQFRRMDLTTRLVEPVEFCDEPERNSSQVPDIKHFFFKIAADSLIWCEQSVSRGNARFYLWNKADNCFRVSGAYSNPFPDYDFFGLNGTTDSSGHIMFTYYFLGKASDSRYKNVLYEIKQGKLIKLWEGELTPNVNYPVSVPPSRNFRQLFFSLSSNGITVNNSKYLVFKTVLYNEQDAIPMRGITSDLKGNFWFATDLKGLFQWDGQNDRIWEIRFNQSGLQKLVYQKNLVLDEKGYLWTCESDSKFVKINTANLDIEQFLIHRVRNFLYHKGLIWYTNETDLLLHLDPETGGSTSVFEQFFPKGAYGTTYLHDLKLGKKSGNLLICSSEGLYDYNPETGSLRTFRTDNPLGKNLPTHHILTIYEDESGTWWLGTNDHGLVRFNPATGETEVYDTKAGLCNNRVVSILPDARGRLWLGTFNGLSCFNPEEQLFENFYKSDGLCHEEFNRLSAYQGKDGQMFFGTVNGVNIFHPDEVLAARANEGTFLLLSTVEYFDKKLGAITLNFRNESPILLGADNRRISLKIAAAYPSVGRQVKFAYLLEGFSDNWVYLPDGQRQIQFEYLPAGRFMLRVKCTNGMGEWSKKELAVPIRVEAFFYQTWWFFLLALGILSFSVFWFYRLYSKQKLASQKTIYLQELDQLKSRLFANITHEFRTPLTLILAPVRKLLRKPDKVSTGELVAGLRLVESNSERLLGLVNQILDLQKLEARQLQVQMEQGDVMVLLRYLTDSFHSLAESKEISLEFHCQPASLFMDFDRDKLMKILGNLLSNALKFTPAGGRVSLSARENGTGAADKAESWLLIQVSDTGAGIPKEKLPKIFELFYQADNSSTRQSEGTGIGLTLAKELVELLGGSIGVESEQGKGSTFQVRLPVNREAQLTSPPSLLKEHAWLHNHSIFNHTQSIETAEGSNHVDFPFRGLEGNTASEVPLILIIEDNPDVARFIASCLSDTYRIELAADGKAGMERILELSPDLVISDVMMPEADGFEVCRFLKNDPRTSHIPVILLTALAEVKHRVEGLRRGADAYLAKPFYEEELLITVEKLLRLRQVLQARYAGLSVPVEAGSPGGNGSAASNGLASSHPATQPDGFDLPLEDVFMSKVLAIVHDHLDDPGFSVEQLNRKMGMSNTQLFQKLKALTNLSANQLIRKIRLEKAKELLQNTELNVSEIAYQTGFSDPAYFTRIFTRELGVSPTEFKKG